MHTCTVHCNSVIMMHLELVSSLLQHAYILATYCSNFFLNIRIFTVRENFFHFIMCTDWIRSYRRVFLGPFSLFTGRARHLRRSIMSIASTHACTIYMRYAIDRILINRRRHCMGLNMHFLFAANSVPARAMYHGYTRLVSRDCHCLNIHMHYNHGIL